MTTNQFIKEHLVEDFDLGELIFKQFGARLENLSDLQSFQMNNHNQDWSNQNHNYGTGIKFNTGGWLQDFDNLSDLEQYSFVNGKLMHIGLNPSLIQMDPGWSGYMWLDSFLYNKNTGCLYRFSSWSWFQMTWHDESNIPPKEIYIPVELFSEGTDLSIPINTAQLTKNKYIESKLVLDADDNGIMTAPDLGHVLSQYIR